MRHLDDLEALSTLVLDRTGMLPEGERLVVGLAGLPGAGKSTTAERLVALLDSAGADAAMLPLDGYHLPNAELVRLGRRDRKGAPDTFDAPAFAVALAEARSGRGGDLRYPLFDRTVDASIPDGLVVPARASVLVAEGNYLLVDEGDWGGVRDLVDIAVYLTTDDATRMTRLVARHVRFGMDTAAAIAWARGPDETNRPVIEASASRADYALTVD